MHKPKKITPVGVNPDWWATSLLPEGLLERWEQCDRAFVEEGEPLAAIRIEGALHELTSPASGWLTIESRANSPVEPGSVIGRIEQT